MSETKHTPTPWTKGDHFIEPTMIFRLGVPVAKALDNCDAKEETEANAAFIVRACNAHDDLVRALKGLMWRIDPMSPEDTAPDVVDARAALAKAEGRP